MYQAVLVKYNERSYDLVFQFDHSIIDGASGQAFRSDLLKRYQELTAGTTRALPSTRSYRQLARQTGKGPVDISAAEIIEKFDLEAWAQHGRLIQSASATASVSAHGGANPMRDISYSVDLKSIQGTDEAEVDPFSLVVYLYARLVTRLINVDKVALDLVFQSRVYQDVDYSGVLGMVADVLPVVVSAEQGVREDLETLIQHKLQPDEQAQRQLLEHGHGPAFGPEVREGLPDDQVGPGPVVPAVVHAQLRRQPRRRVRRHMGHDPGTAGREPGDARLRRLLLRLQTQR